MTAQAFDTHAAWTISTPAYISVNAATQCDAPSYSLAEGTYATAIAVGISTNTSGASIRYTTNGTTPSSTTGTVYSSPVSISVNTTLQAIAYLSGMTDSPVTVGVYDIQCAAPTFSPVAGTYSSPQMVTISSTTSGATIRYTTDGSTPGETAGTVYSGAVNINANCTLQAIAYLTGMADSPITTGVYHIPCATPTFSPAAGNYNSAPLLVTISTTTNGATICYTTDGSTPSETNGTIGTIVTLSANATLQAIAYINGDSNSASAVASGIYTFNGLLFSDFLTGTSIGSAWYLLNGGWSENGVLNQTTMAPPYDPIKAIVSNSGVNFPSSLYVIAKVQVMDWTGDARAGICVRTNTSNGEGYNLIFVGGGLAFLNDDVVFGNSYNYTVTLGTWYWFKLALDSTGTLYGKVWPDSTAEPTNWPYSQSGWSDRSSVFPALNGDSTINFSDFAVYAIPQCAAPTFSPAAGTYSSAQSVTISTTTSGASINYTTDGSTPSESAGTAYSSPVNISAYSTLQAIAFEDGYTDSAVTSAVYTFQCATPTFSPASGHLHQRHGDYLDCDRRREHSLHHQWHHTELDGGHRL